MALANRVREASTAEGRVVEEVASKTPAPVGKHFNELLSWATLRRDMVIEAARWKDVKSIHS